MLPLLLLAFIVVPLVELYVLIQVGEAIGVLPTIALLLLDSVLGTVLMRSQGRLAWRRFNLAIAEGRVPARETVDGALVILGGALLLTPGFVTDIFGVALLLPPTRAIARRLGFGLLGGRLKLAVAAPGAAAQAARYAQRRRGARHASDADADVDSTAREVDPRELR